MQAQIRQLIPAILSLWMVRVAQILIQVILLLHINGLLQIPLFNWVMGQIPRL